MLIYSELRQDARRFLALTGYTIQEFEALLPYFQRAFEAYVQTHTLDGKARRQRGYSTYVNCPLPTMEDKLLFILVYLKQASIQQVQGLLFGMSQSKANRWIHRLHPLLNAALAEAGELPVRDADALELSDEAHGLFFHDGTERPIQRPKDPDVQKIYYSGKKKQHTLKNNFIINAWGKVRFLSATWEGKKHDKRVADEAGYTFPQGSTVYQDTGFQGFRPQGVIIMQPKKKPKGGYLTPEEKAENRRIASIRVRIEHAIGSVKRYRIVKDKLRNWKRGLQDQLLETCCGLHNFRLNFRSWYYDTPIP
jgi:hypothetical protein